MSKVLRVGIIGYGGRIFHMSKLLHKFGIPVEIAAIADPRISQIKANNEEVLKNTRFYNDADTMLKNEKLDGAMVGTRCFMHTDMAIKASKYNLPLFLEKPVAISFDQLKRLSKAFKNYKAPTVVSFPLRLSPLVIRAKEMIDAGMIGSVENYNAFNDVTYGDCYFNMWYRNYNEVGGLWLQKATHDFDYLTYLTGSKPKTIAAMNSRRVYLGNKPFELTCDQCDEGEKCKESPFYKYYGQRSSEAVGVEKRKSSCVFSKGIGNEDFGTAMVEYENGAVGTYTQVFYVKNATGRRGTRLYGYKGTIEFDWATAEVKLFYHHKNGVETYKLNSTDGHGGGDEELAYDFLRGMRDKRKSRTPIEDGILSCLTCLRARESSQKKKYIEVKMPV